MNTDESLVHETLSAAGLFENEAAAPWPFAQYQLVTFMAEPWRPADETSRQQMFAKFLAVDQAAGWLTRSHRAALHSVLQTVAEEHPPLAAKMVDHVIPRIRNLGVYDASVAALEYLAGGLAWYSGNQSAARDRFARAFEIHFDLFGWSSPLTYGAYGGVMNSLTDIGAFDEAIAFSQRICERNHTWTDDHALPETSNAGELCVLDIRADIAMWQYLKYLDHDQPLGEAAKDLSVDGMSPEHRARTLAIQADIAARHGKLDQARECITRAGLAMSANAPLNSASRAFIAKIAVSRYVADADFEGARNFLAMSLEGADMGALPRELTALSAYLRADLAAREGNSHDALQLLRMARGYDSPTCTVANSMRSAAAHNVGVALLRAKRAADAVEALRFAQSVSVTDARVPFMSSLQQSIAYNLAGCFELQHQPQKALEILTLALDQVDAVARADVVKRIKGFRSHLIRVSLACAKAEWPEDAPQSWQPVMAAAA